MDYIKHYNVLIERSKGRILDSYTEKHHILPRCLGGCNSSDNLVNLTPEEHFVAHQLLIKLYPNEPKLVYAANMMTVGRCNNKLYGWLKKKHITECRKRKGKQNPSYGKKWYCNPQSDENGKFLPDEVPPNWVPGRKIRLLKCLGCKIEFRQKGQEVYCSDKCYPKRQRRWHGRDAELQTLLKRGYSISAALREMGLGTFSNTSYGLGKWAKEIKDSMPA